MKITQFDDLSSALTNDGTLSLMTIGAGSAFARSLNQNNILLVKGDDHLMIDCGTRLSQALHQYNLPISQIKNFLITHSHADHVGGLEEVQLCGRYVTGQKPSMMAPCRSRLGRISPKTFSYLYQGTHGIMW